MLSAHLSRQKGLQTTIHILLLNRVRNSIPGIAGFLRQPLLRETVDQGKGLSALGAITRTFSVPSVGTSWQFYQHRSEHLLSESNRKSFRGCFLRSSMTACCSLFGGAQPSARSFNSLASKTGQTENIWTTVDISCRTKLYEYCRTMTATLKDSHPHGNHLLYRCFWSDSSGMSWNSNSFPHSGNKNFHSSSLSQQSADVAQDVSFDGSVREEQHENSTASSDQKVLGYRTLKLLSGSCYLPHPDKQGTGGEDAHFICVDGRAIGVADGVGGWADLGVDAGQYARELMSHSVSAIQEEPNGIVDPSRVLEKAYSCTKARGSSTACIVALTEQGIHAVNLGDSGFVVVRDGCTIFRSPIQQHDFNFTYQLESGNGRSLPSSAQVFTFPVAPGDVLIAGTDGLFDNLYNSEVIAVVVHAVRAGLGPQVTAQKIAALAQQRAQDKNRQTPFSTAAQHAGYRYYGGKLDDITVVVSYITAFSNA